LDGEQRQAFRKLLREARTNWVGVIVQAVAERLQVVGCRFGSADGDQAAWDIWQANRLDADSELAQSDALECGSSSVLVQPDDASPVGVSITAEHPTEAVVLYQPG